MIKAIRTLSNGTTLGEAGEFVDKVLISSDGGSLLIGNWIFRGIADRKLDFQGDDRKMKFKGSDTRQIYIQ